MTTAGPLLCAALLASACGGAGWPRVLEPADVADLRDGAPRITKVRDLGQIYIGHGGPLTAESDGVFTIGELLLIEGRGFGKQPTVTLGGRPLEVLWRAAGGGVIGRIPTGVGGGPQPLRLQNRDGQDEASVPLRRLALVLDPQRQQLHGLELSGGSATAPGLKALGQPLTLTGGRRLAVSADGGAAYVLHPGIGPIAAARLSVIDLGAPGGPRLAQERSVDAPAGLLVAAERAPVLLALGPKRLALFDVREPRRAASWGTAELPAEAQGAVAAALSPDGALLAVALAEDNRVVLLDVKPRPDGPHPRVVAQAELLPLARQPLLCDLRFAADGEALWVLTGDNERGRGRGHQPTRVVTLKLRRSAEALELAEERVVELPEAGAPLRLAAARAQPVAAGTTIREAPERAALYLTTATPEGGALWRASGEPAALQAGAERLAGLDLGPDGALAVLAVEAQSGLQALGVHLRGGATMMLPLAPPRPAKAPTSLEVVVQP